MRPTRVLAPLIVALAAAATAACAGRRPAADASVAAAAVPASGSELVQRMHARYAGRWFQTLTFSQLTTIRRPDGSEVKQTWLEAYKAPSRLRIDIAPLTDSNAVIYTADSSFRIRNGKLARASADANPLMPFVASLYNQPVERTLREMARDGYDMTRVRADSWQGAPVFVVGARDASDLKSPQFWVDRDKLVAVRVILAAPDGRSQEFRFEDYRKFGDSWVAMHPVFYTNGVNTQDEVYTDVRIGVPLSDDLFDASKWGRVRHWSERE